MPLFVTFQNRTCVVWIGRAKQRMDQDAWRFTGETCYPEAAECLAGLRCYSVQQGDPTPCLQATSFHMSLFDLQGDWFDTSVHH